LYRITNNGSAVGLFSNRNHAAVLLAALFPMLAVFASVGIKTEEQAKLKAWACLAAGGVLIPLVLVTGSRAGLITAAIGLAIAPFLYVRPSIVRPKKRRTNRVSPAIGLVALGALALVLITVLFFRAQAFERLAAPDQTEDLRFQIWGPIMATGWQHFPIGSGVGTFPEVYQVHERFELLSPNYVNHAHNDFLEVFTTAGLPGVLLIAAAGLALIRGASKAWRAPREGGAERALGRLGSVILLLLALASLVDYPLRVPSLMGLAVIAAVWLSGPGNAKQAASRTPIDR
jgi:O-antigen ligase